MVIVWKTSLFQSTPISLIESEIYREGRVEVNRLRMGGGGGESNPIRLFADNPNLKILDVRELLVVDTPVMRK